MSTPTFLKRLAYRLQLYRLHPAISDWIFTDRTPTDTEAARWARELVAQHPEWQDPAWVAEQIRKGKRWTRR